MSIADRILEPQQMTLEPSAHQLLEKHFENVVSTREPDAKGSNGRGVRNLLEAAKRSQAGAYIRPLFGST